MDHGELTEKEWNSGLERAMIPQISQGRDEGQASVFCETLVRKIEAQ